MKKIFKKKLHIGSFVVLFNVIFPSHAGINNTTYFGADIVISSTKFKKDFGSNIISKKLIPGLNLFMGHMFNKYFGLEFGIEFYKKMNRVETIIGDGAIVLGEKLPVGPPEYWESHKTSFAQRHVYLGIIGKINVNENNVFSLLVGVSLPHMKFQHTVFDDSDGYIRNDGNIIGIFCKNKIIPTIRATIEHKFNDKIGVRALLSWKNSATFKIKPLTNQSARPTIKAKDTYTFGIGIAYYM